MLLAGCSNPERPRLSAISTLSVVQLSRRVSEIRALGFSPESAQGRLAALTNADLNGKRTDRLTELARAYKRLGLMAESVDVNKAVAELARLMRLAVYDPEHGGLMITPQGAKLAEALAGGRNADADQIPALMVLTSVLQDQHFQWRQRLDGLGSEDRRLAFRALADGDALLVALNHLTQHEKPLNWGQAISRFAGELEKTAAHLPELLKQELVFPYRDGSQFAQWAFLAKGWNGVNALFADPPLTSAQILHPEKYYVRRQAPLRITFFGLNRQLQEGSVLDETLGAFRIQVLLGANRSLQEARQLASGWTGDNLSTYSDGEGWVTVWISAWSDDRAAQAFERAYRSVLERHHRLRFDRLPEKSQGWKANPAAQRSMVLQARGSVVLFLDGMASTRAQEVSEEIWQSLNIAPESADWPFDLATRSAYRSLSSR